MSHEAVTGGSCRNEHGKEMLAYGRELLREHMGLPRKPDHPAPPPTSNIAGFFLGKGPGTARCRLSACRAPILPGNYRFALAPAMALDN